MTNQKPQVSLCMIVKATDDEAVLLDRCLRSISKHVDEICITITGENKACSDVVAKYKGKESYYKWNNDFASARNFNFSQASGDWILWLDADDIVKGGENIKPLVSSKECELVDAIVSDYFYDFNEDGDCIVQHLKTMIIRNNGSLEWEGVGIHEDFKNNRAIHSIKTNVFQRLHQPDKTDIKDSSIRNFEISKEWIVKKPEDPRSWWNYANSLMMIEDWAEALKIWIKFIEMSHSDEEKYIAWDRMASACIRLDDLSSAYDCELSAMGIRPWYPDAWVGLGEIAFRQKKFEHAKFFLLESLRLKPPTDEIIAYNPRTYDLIPLQLLAKTYYQLKQPKDALACLAKARDNFPRNKELNRIYEEVKKEVEDIEVIDKLLAKASKVKTKKGIKKILDELPEEFKCHPKAVHLKNVHFIKTETTGKEVTIYCAETSEQWSPESLKTGIGGSEEAVIHLSQRFAKAGYDVTVYASIGHNEFVHEGVTWKPFWSWNVRDKHDTLILWRTPGFVDFNIDAKTILVDLHDVIPQGEFTPERLKKITKIMVKTKAHRDLFPNVPDEKFVIVPNGIDPKQFDQIVERKKNKLLMTSSPDRGLECAIKLLPYIREQVPDAELHWYYGWGNFDRWHKDDPAQIEWANKVRKMIKETPGVFEGGRIGHQDIAREYMSADIFFYPTQFYEIHCISAVKGQAGGAIPVTTNFAALNETVQFGTKIETANIYTDKEKQKEMVDTIVAYLKGEKNEDREAMSKWAKETYDWDNIAKEWIKQF